MRAVLFERPGAVVVGDAPEPRIEEPDDAVVRVTLSAICGSDLHAFHAKLPMSAGESMGHEAVGVVEATGAGVSRIRSGDRVVVSFGNACGSCWYCGRGETSLCDRFRALGFGRAAGGLGGTQSELVRVPFAEFNLLRVPDGMQDERAIFVGDILTTGWYGARLARVEPGESVAVVGAGPVGFFSAQAARAQGARTVLLLDVEPSRLALAGAAGATPVNVRDVDPREAVKELTGGRGADVAVDAVGQVPALMTAMTVARRGGRVCVIGVYGPETADMPLGRVWLRGLRLFFAGVCPVHAWWDEAMRAVESGTVDPVPVISHRLGLDDAAMGYDLFDRKEATKVVLLP